MVTQLKPIPYSPFKEELERIVRGDQRKLVALLLRMRSSLIKKAGIWYVPADIAAVIKSKAKIMIEPDYDDTEDRQIINNYMQKVNIDYLMSLWLNELFLI